MSNWKGGCGVFAGELMRELLAPRPRGAQEELAEMLGLHNSVISLWATNQRPVPWVRVPALAAALGLGEEAFLARAQRIAEEAAGTAGVIPREMRGAAVATAAPQALEVSCALCGRGVGPEGQLALVAAADPRLRARWRCTWCGGRMRAMPEVDPTSLGEIRDLMRAAQVRGRLLAGVSR